MGQKLSNIHCVVDKTTNLCESYLTKTYAKIAGASSCRCIRIAGCLRYNRGSFTWVLGEYIYIYIHGKVRWEAMIGENRS